MKVVKPRRQRNIWKSRGRNHTHTHNYPESHPQARLEDPRPRFSAFCFSVPQPPSASWKITWKTHMRKQSPRGYLQGNSVGQGGDTGAARGTGLHRCPRGFGPSRKAAASSLRHADAPLGGKQCIYCKGFRRLVTREGEFQALPSGNGGPNTKGLWAFPRGPRLQVAVMFPKKPPGSGPK